MKKDRKIDIISVIALVLAIICTSIAYLALSKTLTIIGSDNNKLDGLSWKIRFNDLKVDTRGEASFSSLPKLDKQSTTISDYEGILTKPGDIILIKFKIENVGALDAVVSDYDLGKISYIGNKYDKDIISNNVKYELKYYGNTSKEATGTVIKSGTSIEKGQLLKSGESVDMILRISYEGDKLPSDKVMINIGKTSINYVEAG